MPDRDWSAYRAAARGGLIGISLGGLVGLSYAASLLEVVPCEQYAEWASGQEHKPDPTKQAPAASPFCRKAVADITELLAQKHRSDGRKQQQSLWLPVVSAVGGLFSGLKITDVLLALFTFWLAWRTGGLFKSTRGLENEARDQHETLRQSVEVARQSGEAAKVAAQAALRSAELASAQFIATHRPRLTVRAVFLLETGLPDVGDRLIILVYNKGDTSATMVEVSFYFQISGPRDVYLPQAAVTDPALPEIIRSGHQCQIEASINSTWREWKEIADAAIAQDVGNATRWYVELRVSIAYLDDSGRRRQTSIDRTYDIRHRSFGRIEGSDFEYED